MYHNKKLDNILCNNQIPSLLIYKNRYGIIYDKSSDYSIDVRSVAKTISSLAAGILIEDPNYEFNEQTMIYPIIEDIVKIHYPKNIHYIKKIKVKHLLTHTIGYTEVLLKRNDLRDIDKDDLINYVLNQPIVYEPGTYYLYSNAGMFILGVVISNYLNLDFYDYINENIFTKLDIINPRWDRHGSYIVSSSNLYLSPKDLLKIGRLILDGGMYNGKRVIPEKFIEKMTSAKVENKHNSRFTYLREDFYGYGIWISENNIIFASGTGGNLIVIIKDLDMVIVAANSNDISKQNIIKEEVDKLIKILMEDTNDL